MVSTLRAVGITHFCSGNHEADLQLPVLKDRIAELTKSAVFVNSNVHPTAHDNSSKKKDGSHKNKWLWKPPLAQDYAIIKSPDDRVKVALLGIMSDEDNVFRDNTFRGVPIQNVMNVFQEMYTQLVPSQADMILPMTHQSIQRDRELAQFMLQTTGGGRGLIIGGHDHSPMDEVVFLDSNESEEDSIRIFKSGSDAESARLIDLSFDVSIQPPKLVQLETTLVDLTTYQDSKVVKKIADRHLQVVDAMENEIIIQCDNMPPGQILSSEGARIQQTTVGSYFCQAIKEELEVDVALMNGGSIKGGTTYTDNHMSYAQLKKELPFPTKMVVIEMPRSDLQHAIYYSRNHVEQGAERNAEGKYERRGFLQVDLDFDLDPHTGDHDDVLQVALPRNLLNGFCKIEPLMTHAEELKRQGRFPGSDEYVPALDLIVRHSCRKNWFQIVHEYMKFGDLDLNKDGVLDRYEVKTMLEQYLGHEPADFVVDNMIASIDTDENGVVDVGELSHLIATMEREEQWRKF